MADCTLPLRVTPVMTFVDHNSSHTVVFFEEPPPATRGDTGARSTDRVFMDSWTVAVGEILDARTLGDSLRNKYDMSNEAPAAN